MCHVDGAYRWLHRYVQTNANKRVHSQGSIAMFYKDELHDMTDEQLYAIALEKQRNGNGTARAYAAQRYLKERNAPYRMHGYRNGSSKRYSYNEDYMGFETDNR